jgi:hypothetical protein
MYFITDLKKDASCTGARKTDVPNEPEPMHPDDFTAHLAWVTAKRFHETGLGQTFAEKPAFYKIIGQPSRIQ